MYRLVETLPKSEDFNLKSQSIRAATSIALNIAEGSTGQSDAEQARFLGMAIRSLVETVACQHLVPRRGYLQDLSPLDAVYAKSNDLARQLQAFRRTLNSTRKLADDRESYLVDKL